MTDTTTDGQKRNGRDLTVRAERSTLAQAQAQSSRKTVNSGSLQQDGDLTVAQMTRNRQRGPTLLHLRRLVSVGGE